MTSTGTPTSETAATPTPTTETTTEDFATRLFAAVLGAQEVQAVYIGDRLGWYRALAEGGPMTSTELAERTATSERYAREWLEHQAVCGYLSVDRPDAAPTERRFRLSPPQAEVLADHDSLAFLTPVARFVAGVGAHLPALVEAYRTGGGVSWEQLGTDAREAQADANRPLFLHQLGQELLPAVPEVHTRLDAGARVADVGCGAGWSSIGIALSYPLVTVDGFDLDEMSIEMARRHAAEAGVSDRVRFHATDAGTLTGVDPYDVVFAFECVHDLADPVGVLSAMRRLAGDRGTVIVVDERTEDRFVAPAGDVERLLYGYSLTCCLPDAMAQDPTAATGTVMRPETLRRYARRAGFADVDLLAVDHELFRFYRLDR